MGKVVTSAGILWLIVCLFASQIPSARLDNKVTDCGQSVLCVEIEGLLDGNPAEIPFARTVDGTVVPPFGGSLENLDGTPFSWSKGYLLDHLVTWPEFPSAPDDKLPLADGKWTGGPYRNSSGKRCIERINAWYREGTGAGFKQDVFRSFDNGHSSVLPGAYPSLRIETPVAQLSPVWENVFRPRVTTGVQSCGSAGRLTCDSAGRIAGVL